MLGAGAGASTEALLRSVVRLFLVVVVVGFGEVGRGMAMLAVFGDRRRGTRLVMSSFSKVLVVVPLPFGASPLKGTEQHRQHPPKARARAPVACTGFLQRHGSRKTLYCEQSEIFHQL